MCILTEEQSIFSFYHRHSRGNDEHEKNEWKNINFIMFDATHIQHTRSTEYTQCMQHTKSLHILSTIKDYVCTLLDRLDAKTCHTTLGTHTLDAHTQCRCGSGFHFELSVHKSFRLYAVRCGALCECFFAFAFASFSVHVWWHYQRETSTNNWLVSIMPTV